MAMQKIGKMLLKNTGGFVARIAFTYVDVNGNATTQADPKGQDILLGASSTVDPGDRGVPDGSLIYLHVYVLHGQANQASRAFLYEKGNTAVANYVISGTTVDNDLGLMGIS